MPTRNVVLTARHEQFIAKLVKSGRYQNASEVLRDGLRLVEANEAEYRRKLRLLRQAIKVGENDAAAGRYVEFDNPAALERFLRNRLATRPRRRAA
jgi:antitoxin ParD1/3/4